MILMMEHTSVQMTYCLAVQRQKFHKDRLDKAKSQDTELNVFPSLVLRKKWHTQRRDVQLNDVVTYVDENAVRGKWTIARVIETFPGQDRKQEM